MRDALQGPGDPRRLECQCTFAVRSRFPKPEAYVIGDGAELEIPAPELMIVE